MSAASRLQYLYLAYLSRPKAERKLYRMLRSQQPVRIVELGLGTIERTLRLLAVAQRFAPGQRLEYTGLDLFDARPEGAPPLPLIVAHRRLKTTDARVKLVPGDPAQSLRSAANALPKTDLLLIAGSLDADVWLYLPRMLHEGSLVLQMPDPPNSTAAITVIERAEIDRRAQPAPRRRAA